MKELNKNEIQLNGSWIFENKSLIADNVTNRIFDLTQNFLKKICEDESGWDSLYKNPLNGDYWELIYQDTSLHGGGPPTLRYLSDKSALFKYRF